MLSITECSVGEWSWSPRAIAHRLLLLLVAVLAPTGPVVVGVRRYDRGALGRKESRRGRSTAIRSTPATAVLSSQQPALASSSLNMRAARAEPATDRLGESRGRQEPVLFLLNFPTSRLRATFSRVKIQDTPGAFSHWLIRAISALISAASCIRVSRRRASLARRSRKNRGVSSAALVRRTSCLNVNT